jgi:hypothetical protein
MAFTLPSVGDVTMVFDRHTEVLEDPLREEWVALEPCAPYHAATAEGRLHNCYP